MDKTFVVLLMLLSSGNQIPLREQGCRPASRGVTYRMRHDNVIDLTYVFDDRTAVWPNSPTSFELFKIFTGFVTAPFRYYYEAFNFSSPEHAGTHMDAPIHFGENKNSVEQISLQNLYGQGVLIDLVSDGNRYGGDSLIGVQDILDYEANKGKRIRSGSIVLFRTGYGELYYDKDEYFGTNLNGSDVLKNLHFPGLDPATAEWLISNRCISAVGIDTPSIDYGKSLDFKAHQTFSSSNIPIFENVANLGTLQRRSTKGFNVIALPYLIKGGSGAPVRIIAVLR